MKEEYWLLPKQSVPVSASLKENFVFIFAGYNRCKKKGEGSEVLINVFILQFYEYNINTHHSG